MKKLAIVAGFVLIGVSAGGVVYMVSTTNYGDSMSTRMSSLEADLSIIRKGYDRNAELLSVIESDLRQHLQEYEDVALNEQMDSNTADDSEIDDEREEVATQSEMDRLYQSLTEQQRRDYFDPNLTPEQILERLRRGGDALNRSNVATALTRRFGSYIEYLKGQGYNESAIEDFTSDLRERSLDAEQIYLEAFSGDPEAFSQSRQYLSANDLAEDMTGSVDEDELSVLEDFIVDSEEELFSNAIEAYGLSESATDALRDKYAEVISSSGGPTIGVGPVSNWVVSRERLEALQAAKSELENQLSPPDMIAIDSAIEVLEERTYRMSVAAETFSFAYKRGHYETRR